MPRAGKTPCPPAAIFRRLLAGQNHGPAGGREVRFSFFIQFSPAITPPFAARPSDTAPTVGAGAKIAPASPPHPRHCHAFRFRQAFNALPRTARCLPIRRSERQTAGRRTAVSKKSYENHKAKKMKRQLRRMSGHRRFQKPARRSRILSGIAPTGDCPPKLS